jgi:hypothetical protein
MLRTALLILLICSPLLARAQDSVVVNEGFRQSDGWTFKKGAATAMVGGVLAGSLVNSYFDWWKDAAQPFHFVSEGFLNDYSLGIDKVGHAYTSYFYFHTFRDLLLWGGYTPREAFWWGAGGSAFFAISIEVGDAVSPFGFSWEDLTWNMLGLGYGMLQTQVPILRNVSFKWSYIPNDGWRWPPRFTDHYDAHTYWLAFNMHNLLPESWGDYWPEFLQLAVGYGVDDRQSRRELVFGIDFNLEAFGAGSQEVLLGERLLNRFHIPAPAVKFTEGRAPKWYLLHPN